MRTFKAFLFLAAITSVIALSGGGAGAQAPQFHQEVRVQAAKLPGATTAYFLTFSGPFSIPGVSLAPGTYLFRRPSAGAVQVLSADRQQAYVLAMTIPTYRAVATKDHEILFAESEMVGAPRRIVSWFLPGATVGQELIYPKWQVRGYSN